MEFFQWTSIVPGKQILVTSLKFNLLPPANGVAKVMFTVVSVGQSFCRQGGGVPCTGPQPWPSSVEALRPLTDTFKPVYYEAWTVGKQEVGIRLKYLLVLS